MTERSINIPPSHQPESLEQQMAQLRKWIEGYIDDKGSRHAGLIEMVGELFEELRVKRERREVICRALGSGGILAVIGVTLAWLKDHLK